MGDNVAFLDKSDIAAGNFVCSGSRSGLNPKTILSQLINSEEELRLFCATYDIGHKDDHVFSMVVDAHAFLMQKIRPKAMPNRKRPALDQLGNRIPKHFQTGEMHDYAEEFSSQSLSELPSAENTELEGDFDCKTGLDDSFSDGLYNDKDGVKVEMEDDIEIIDVNLAEEQHDKIEHVETQRPPALEHSHHSDGGKFVFKVVGSNPNRVESDLLDIHFLDPGETYVGEDVFDATLATRPMPYLQRFDQSTAENLPVLVGVHPTDRRSIGFTVRFPDKKFYHMVKKTDGIDGNTLLTICVYV